MYKEYTNTYNIKDCYKDKRARYINCGKEYRV